MLQLFPIPDTLKQAVYYEYTSVDGTKMVVVAFTTEENKDYPSIFPPTTSTTPNTPTSQLFNVVDYEGIDDVPTEEVPAIILSPPGSKTTVKKCAHATTPMPEYTTPAPSHSTVPPTYTTPFTTAPMPTTPTTYMPPTTATPYEYVTASTYCIYDISEETVDITTKARYVVDIFPYLFLFLTFKNNNSIPLILDLNCSVRMIL